MDLDLVALEVQAAETVESCIQARKEEADTEEAGWVEEDWVRVAPEMEAAGVTVPGTEEAPLGAEAGR